MMLDFLYNFIRQFKYAVVSTVSPDNFPESAAIGIAVTGELKIIFDTLSDARKYKNILLNPGVSLVIGWENEQTVQYEGIVRIPGSREFEELLRTYYTVFPDGIERRENLPNLVYVCVDPVWIRYSDFTGSPAKIEEIKF